MGGGGVWQGGEARTEEGGSGLRRQGGKQGVGCELSDAEATAQETGGSRDRGPKTRSRSAAPQGRSEGEREWVREPLPREPVTPRERSGQRGHSTSQPATQEGTLPARQQRAEPGARRGRGGRGAQGRGAAGQEGAAQAAGVGEGEAPGTQPPPRLPDELPSLEERHTSQVPALKWCPKAARGEFARELASLWHRLADHPGEVRL